MTDRLSEETLRLIAEKFDAVATGEQIGHDAFAAIPQLQASGTVDDLVAAATSNVTAILDGLARGVPGSASVAPNESLEWAESLVHRSVDLSAVPWAYSYGQSRVLEALRDAVERTDIPSAQKWEVASALSRYVNQYVERVCAEMVEHYTVTRDRHYGAAGTARRQAVDQLLAGTTTDEADAAAELGYPLEGTQLAAIVWADPRSTGPAVPIAGPADALLRELGAAETLVVPAGENVVWAWGTGAAVDDGPDAAPALTPGLFAAVGALGAGAAGFRRSHDDAAQARRMADLLGRRSGTVVRYRAVALTALIASDPRQATRFVEDELGALRGDTDQLRRLRATLSVFLDEGMRPVRAARRLGVHQNTVLYRVKQAEGLLGRPLSTRRLELEAALRLADARGPE